MRILFLKFIGAWGALWGASKVALEWTGWMEHVRERIPKSATWVMKAYSVLSAPSGALTLLIFTLSAGLFGLLVYVDRKKPPTGKYANPLVATGGYTAGDNQEMLQPLEPHNPAVDCRQFQNEWDQLDEEDREIVREIVLKGGLMDSDITALLKVRGFSQNGGMKMSITDRITFIHCDYMGFHSIVPACQTWLNQTIREEMKDASFSREFR